MGWVARGVAFCGVVVVVDVVLLGFFAFCGCVIRYVLPFAGFGFAGVCGVVVILLGFGFECGCDGCVWTRYGLLVLGLVECGCGAWGGLGIRLVF